MDWSNPSSLQFSGDSLLGSELAKEPAVAESLKHSDALRSRARTRTGLLSGAVRIDARLMPSLSQTISSLTERALGVGDVECYVYSNPGINAFVSASAGSRTLVGLTSGAVNGLDQEELRFLLGHELGHVLFDHLEVDIEGLSREGSLSPATSMRLRAWQRAMEISADRVGLVCCGSLRHAARALFKSVSGLTAGGLAVRPEYFAEQWRHLADEIAAEGSRDHWQMSHPFPPLRMKAMTIFGESRSLERADSEVSRMLALMDPGSDGGALGDPLLADFLFWGGLYVALADRVAVPAEIARLQTVAPAGVDVDQLVRGGDVTDEHCLRRFTDTVARRRRKLSAVEKHGIITGLIDVASSDGQIDSSEFQRLVELGREVGVPTAGCELIVRQYLEERNSVD